LTAPTLPPHEDDLRTFAAGLHSACVSADAAVRAVAHDEDPGADLTAAVERAFDALRLRHGLHRLRPAAGGGTMSGNPSLLGVRADRPPAPPRRYVATDWNDWHTRLVVWDATDEALRLERRSGTLDLPASCKRMGRRGGGSQVRHDRLPVSTAMEEGRRLLVEAHVVTAACAGALQEHDIRVLLEDLQRRIAVRREFGLELPDPSDDGNGGNGG
jgi:hypothetical protein